MSSRTVLSFRSAAKLSRIIDRISRSFFTTFGDTIVIKLGKLSAEGLELIVYPGQGSEFTMLFSWDKIAQLIAELVRAQRVARMNS